MLALEKGGIALETERGRGCVETGVVVRTHRVVALSPAEARTAQRGIREASRGRIESWELCCNGFKDEGIRKAKARVVVGATDPK